MNLDKPIQYLNWKERDKWNKLKDIITISAFDVELHFPLELNIPNTTIEINNVTLNSNLEYFINDRNVLQELDEIRNELNEIKLQLARHVHGN